jgi:RNA polymerase subunit RPABC4/transcription elongation factor Spt4
VSDSEQSEGGGVAAPVARLKTFPAGEMVTCERCARTNPPNRSQCLYCGSGLPGVTLAADPISVEQTEASAPRATLCLSADPLQNLRRDVLAELARLVGAKIEDLATAVAAGGVLPLAAATNSAEEEKLTAQIRDLGLELFTVVQEDARFRKIRGLDLSSGVIRPLPPASEDFAYHWSGIVLIVIGRIVTTKIEIDEKRRRGKSKPLDARQFSSDQLLMDLHFKGGETWRVYAEDFDYSCLRDRKAVTGFENFGRLLDLINERAPSVEIDKSYAKKRALLASVWPLDEENRNTVSFMRERKHRHTTISSNESQFNKYSRAAYLLKMNTRERAE